jgi:quinol monooxygenase YgiN
MDVMSPVITVATAYPVREYRAEVLAAFEKAVARVHGEEPGVELYALHEGRDCLVLIEKYMSHDAAARNRAGPARAELLAAIDGKLSSPLDVRTLVPRPAGDLIMGEL